MFSSRTRSSVRLKEPKQRLGLLGFFFFRFFYLPYSLSLARFAFYIQQQCQTVATAGGYRPGSCCPVRRHDPTHNKTGINVKKSPPRGWSLSYKYRNVSVCIRYVLVSHEGCAHPTTDLVSTHPPSRDHTM